MAARIDFQALEETARRVMVSMLIIVVIQASGLAAPQGNVAPVEPGTAPVGNLRVGAARVDITPTDLTNLNPFGGKFNGVHDSIYARTLVIDNGATMAAFVALDLIEVGDSTEVRQRIQRELGIPVDHILITASHDHSAPRAGSVTPGGLAHGETPETDAFTKTLYDKVVGALKQAKDSLQPACFGVGAGSVDVNVNRDHYGPQGWSLGYSPDRQSDKTVWVLRFDSMRGEPIAVLFNYAVHSTVTFGTAILNGDLGGEGERIVEQKLGGKVVALYTMGSAGDQAPKYDGTGTQGGGQGGNPGGNGPGGPPKAAGGTPAGANQGGNSAPYSAARIEAAFEANRAQGFMLGSEVVRVIAGIQQTTSSVRISAGERIINCPVKQGTNQMGDMKQQKVDTMPLHLGLIELNDTALVGVSGEVVTNIYWHLKKTSPLANTIMLTIANDRLGYIADDASYDLPIFEVHGSPLARGCAEDAIVNNLTEMIKQHE
jgi:hypothetical protein